MTNNEDDRIQVFLSTIDDIDFSLKSMESYLTLIKDADRQKKIRDVRYEDDKKRSIVSGLLIQYCFHRWLEYNEMRPVDSFHCGKGQYGKPYIEGYEEFHFSISHGGRYVVCAVAKDEVGIDVEERVSKKDVLKLANRFYTESEYKKISQISDREKQEVFFTRLWTMKESYIKYLGRGLGYGMNGFEAEAFEPLSEFTDIAIHTIKNPAEERKTSVCEYFILTGVNISVCCNYGKTFTKPEIITLEQLMND